jgi:hypothetical protein
MYLSLNPSLQRQLMLVLGRILSDVSTRSQPLIVYCLISQGQ